LVTREDSLGTKYPDLLKEWDYTKNKIDPYEVSEYSHKRISWKCDKDHMWDCTVYNRTVGSNCPMCTKGSFSQLGINILNKISKDENINIIHAMNGGEHIIKLNTVPSKNIKVDGFCKETNTVYEINGCFYHAHISDNCYLRRNWDLLTEHPYGKTYGDRYIDTLEREVILSKMGYRVITMWECDCKIILKNNK